MEPPLSKILEAIDEEGGIQEQEGSTAPLPSPGYLFDQLPHHQVSETFRMLTASYTCKNQATRHTPRIAGNITEFSSSEFERFEHAEMSIQLKTPEIRYSNEQS